MSDALRSEIGLYPTYRPWTDRAAFGLVISGLIIAALLFVLAPHIFVTIDPGHRGVLWSRFGGGTQNTVYGEGTHLIFPWDVMYVYDIRVLEMSAPTLVLTRGDLEVTVHVSIRFRPRVERLPEIQRRYGPDYARKFVYQEVSTALQRAFGNETYQSIVLPGGYDSVINKTLFAVRMQLAGEPVSIEAIRINRILLPPELRQAVHDKLREQQLAELYLYRIVVAQREAQVKAAEAEGIRRFSEIVAGGLDERFLQWQGIQATMELARSPNAKIVIIGKGTNGLPIIFDPNVVAPPAGAPPTGARP